MKRTFKESVEIFFIGYSDNKDAQKYHIIKRMIWIVCFWFVLSCAFTIIKSLFIHDFYNLFYSILGALLFTVPIFLIKLD